MNIGTIYSCSWVYDLHVCTNPLITFFFYHFVLISRNWKMFFTNFIFSDTLCIWGDIVMADSCNLLFLKMQNSTQKFLSPLSWEELFPLEVLQFLHIQLNRQSSGLFCTWRPVLISLSSEGTWGLCPLATVLERINKVSVSNVGSLSLAVFGKTFPAEESSGNVSSSCFLHGCLKTIQASLWSGNGDRGWIHSFHKTEIRCYSVRSVSPYRFY